MKVYHKNSGTHFRFMSASDYVNVDFWFNLCDLLDIWFFILKTQQNRPKPTRGVLGAHDLDTFISVCIGLCML